MFWREQHTDSSYLNHSVNACAPLNPGRNRSHQNSFAHHCITRPLDALSAVIHSGMHGSTCISYASPLAFLPWLCLFYALWRLHHYFEVQLNQFMFQTWVLWTPWGTTDLAAEPEKIIFFIQCILLPWQNLPPALPTMHLAYKPFSWRFGYSSSD